MSARPAQGNRPDTRLPTEPWARDGQDVLAALGVNPDQGLSEAAARQRRILHGANRLRERRPRPLLTILTDQFRSVVVALLAAATVLAFLFGDIPEGIAIVVVLFINAAIGFVTEWRAVRSMEALRRLGQVATRVRRDGQVRSVPAEDLVPGDIVLLDAGDAITADLRLLESAKLAVDESTLTGESVPVAKRVEPLPPATRVMDRSNMGFRGTNVTRGSGLAVVTFTGLATELGRISELVTSASAQATPLQERINQLGRLLVWVTLGLSALIAVAGVLSGRDLRLAVEVAIALAVAAIPEGLPIVATIALARGMWRMARRNALITRLSAVETLGATGVILTDKTGTLTENRMTVAQLELPNQSLRRTGDGINGFQPVNGPLAGAALDELLTAVALCSNATLRKDATQGLTAEGDPTEIALLMAAAQRGLDRTELLKSSPERHEEPFDPDIKAMATFNETSDGLRVYVKGAPEAVLPMCTLERGDGGERTLEKTARERIAAQAAAIAADGLRTLAVATRPAVSVDEAPYQDLSFLGLVGLLDPAREGVRSAIERCRRAGIRVVMVTGDHSATAANIAVRTGILEEPVVDGEVFDASRWSGNHVDLDDAALSRARVFARAAPAQKLNLIDRYQDQDEVVAMTGDGVNDAPALKKADIGIAMGVRGTQVAKDASAMVLQDDEFSTIVAAIDQGRAIYANLRTFVVYLLSCNTSELLIIGLATVAGAPLPLLPLQILFLNLVTDVFPALALGVGKGPPGLMHQPPRPASEQILERRHWVRIVAHGTGLALTVLSAMAAAHYVLGLDQAQSVTVSFLTLALAQLVHVLNMRGDESTFLRNEVVANPWIWVAGFICLVLLALALWVPALAGVLRLVDPGRAGFALVVGFSLVPLLLGPLVRRLTRRTA
jgi:Ca2+-transporting ATPase